MRTLIHIFILIDLAAAAFLLFAIVSNSQDAAGKGMALLPILILVCCGIGAYSLMQHQFLITAIALSGVPTLVIAYLLFISVT